MPGCVLGSLSVSVCCEVCGDVCAVGRRHRRERVMSGPRAEAGNGVHRGAGRIRDTAERAEKERGERRGKKSQGEVLHSLTTKMEVRQGQIVGDHLTVEGCTCLIFPDIRGHHRSLPDSSLTQSEALKDGELTSYTWRILIAVFIFNIMQEFRRGRSTSLGYIYQSPPPLLSYTLISPDPSFSKVNKCLHAMSCF